MYKSAQPMLACGVLTLALATLALQPNALGQGSHTLPLGFGPPLTGAPFSATRTLDDEPVAGSSDPVSVHARPALQINDASTHAAQPAYRDDPKFQKALAQAKERKQTQEERLDHWKHANKVAHEQCVECLREIATLQAKTGAYKNAVKTAQQMEALATEPRDLLFAESMRGVALMRFNYGQPKPEQLQQAEAAFHDVLAKSPQSREILFQDGRALAMLGRDAEARSTFAKYVDMTPASDSLHTRAERFSDDPHLATLPMAPPFRMVTSDGEELQLDNMNGKVVVLDFWATWCGPCKKSLPEIASIAKEYANDPMLVLISVSTDSDGAAWQKFVEQNKMTWTQYRDTNRALSLAYGISSIPRFFTIDTNGVLKSEQSGSDANVGAVVSDLVKKAHKAEAQKAKATDKGSGQ